MGNQANYKGISLLDILDKIYTRILTRMVTFYADVTDKIDSS